MPQIYRIKLLKGNQCSKDLYNHNKVPAMKSHCRQTIITPLRSIYHKTKCIGNCIFRLKGETCIPYWKWILRIWCIIEKLRQTRVQWSPCQAGTDGQREATQWVLR